MSCRFCELINAGDNPTKIVEFSNSLAYLNLDQSRVGRSLVILKGHYDDMLDVPASVVHALLDEMLVMSRAINAVLQPDRLNFAVLGNEIAHVHWHVIPRYKEVDETWGGPPWPISRRQYLEESEYFALAGQLRKAVGSLRTAS